MVWTYINYVHTWPKPYIPLVLGGIITPKTEIKYMALNILQNDQFSSALIRSQLWLLRYFPAIRRNETSEGDLVTHNPKQVKDKRNALHAVVRDLHDQSELISGEKKYF